MAKKETTKRAKKTQPDFSGSMIYGEDGLAVSLSKEVAPNSSISIDFDADGVYCGINGEECDLSWEELQDAIGLVTGSIDPAEYFDISVDEDGKIQVCY